MFRALAAFLDANKDRRNLLLCQGPASKVCKDVFLLLGPPGTGKTSIFLKKMVEDQLAKEGDILLIAYTNRAVDEICSTLSKIEGTPDFIRIGSELNCAPEFRDSLIDNCLTKYESRKEAKTALEKCRIYVGTSASVWNNSALFNIKHFDLAVIDEATQLLEPHLLGFFCVKNTQGKNAIDRFVLIGDYKQLPAIALQSREESKIIEQCLNEVGIFNFSDSLFERLFRKFSAEALTANFHILTRQGRMHPEISAFPSRFFYNGKLESAGLPHQIESAGDKRVQFFSIKPADNDLSEKSNIEEAKKIVKICKDLYDNALKNKQQFNPDSVGIITPFRKQIALIRKLLNDTGIQSFSEIMTDTVERFQGSQRDIIIYSFCIKKHSQLLTLPNITVDNGKTIDRKLNVALTRARKQLFVIGNAGLLRKNEIYRLLIEYIS